MTNRILVYDIETCGINARFADLGYIITFGYIWLEDFIKAYEKGQKPKVKTISIADFDRYKKDPQDDRLLLKAASKILLQADGIIHHYGDRFDAPFVRTRMLLNNQGEIFPEAKQLDTCILAWKKLKLSANRLAHIAKVLKCKYQKVDKKDGWPKWWNDFAKGGTKYDAPMRHYCGYDVLSLAEISIKMRPYWPNSFMNQSIIRNGKVCIKCASDKLAFKEYRVIGAKEHRLYRCTHCGYSYNKEPVPGKRGVFR